jgi:hypothetical protein
MQVVLLMSFCVVVVVRVVDVGDVSFARMLPLKSRSGSTVTVKSRSGSKVTVKKPVWLEGYR